MRGALTIFDRPAGTAMRMGAVEELADRLGTATCAQRKDGQAATGVVRNEEQTPCATYGGETGRAAARRLRSEMGQTAGVAVESKSGDAPVGTVDFVAGVEDRQSRMQVEESGLWCGDREFRLS